LPTRPSPLNVYYKNKESITEDITLKSIILKSIILKSIILKSIILKSILYYKNKKDKQRHKKIITSLVKVKLKRL
jgi:hypothetical protein